MDASGSIALAEANLRRTLADVSAVRTWLGAADQAAALARIYLNGLPQPAGRTHTLAELEALRPYVIVYTEARQGFALDLAGMGDSCDYSARGRLGVRLEQDCPEAYDDEPSGDANIAWLNTLGLIVDGLVGLSGQPGYLAWHHLEMEGPWWTPKAHHHTYGRCQSALLILDWRGI